MTSMFDVQTGVLALLILAVSLWGAVRLIRWSVRRPPRAERSDRDMYEQVERPAMPPELRTARLWLNEALIKSDGATQIGARVDQAFETVDGRLILVETKRRHWARVKRSDQVQLSAQRYILQKSLPVASRQRLADYGYVRIVGTGLPRYLRVGLLGPSAIEAMVARRNVLIRGAKPWVADRTSACKACRVRNHCVVWAQRSHRPLSAWWTPEQRQWLAATARRSHGEPMGGRDGIDAKRRPDETATSGERQTPAGIGDRGSR